MLIIHSLPARGHCDISKGLEHFRHQQRKSPSSHSYRLPCSALSSDSLLLCRLRQSFSVAFQHYHVHVPQIAYKSVPMEQPHSSAFDFAKLIDDVCVEIKAWVRQPNATTDFVCLRSSFFGLMCSPSIRTTIDKAARYEHSQEVALFQ